MDEQKERKSTFFTEFEKSGKRSSQLVGCTILISQLSLKVCHLKAQHLIQFPNICSGKYILAFVHQRQQRDDRAFYGLSLKRHTNSIAAVENNSMRFCISLTHI